MTPEVRGYLKTLRRIPEDVILSVATREINTTDYAVAGQSCLLGWAFRESLARCSGAPVESIGAPAAVEHLSHDDTTPINGAFVAVFGGDRDEWRKIYKGVTDARQEAIEEAFAIRVAECA